MRFNANKDIPRDWSSLRRPVRSGAEIHAFSWAWYGSETLAETWSEFFV